jgi:hypothetical protein
MPGRKFWRNALLAIILFWLAAFAWANRFEPARSPYFHKNRYTGAQCHRGVECWVPRTPPPGF